MDFTTLEETITSRLLSLGYAVKEGDAFALGFVFEKCSTTIIHFCNVSEVPTDLEKVLVDFVCAEFLRAKKSSGQLSEIELDAIVKAIDTGDTKTEFAVGNVSADEKFYLLLNKLSFDPTSPDLLYHRKIVW